MLVRVFSGHGRIGHTTSDWESLFRAVTEEYEFPTSLGVEPGGANK